MVAQNLILVRGIFSFIPNATEQERKSNQNRRNELGNNVSSSTENGSSENHSPIADSQTFHPNSLLHYRNNFNNNISFKPLYLPHLFALLFQPKILCISSITFMFHAPP